MRETIQAVAIIPARGGSKGIPRKNLQEVGGIPLIGRSVLAARGARHVQAVYVSTDDAEIASVAQEYGAQIIWRPAELATDTASSESALLHALEMLREHGSEVELIVFIQCTSPFVEPQDIDAMIEKMQEEQADCIFTVTPFHGFLWKSDAQLGAVGVNHDRAVRPRRQERAPQFLETGAVYVMRTGGFLRTRHRFFGRVLMYEVPPERSIEIDEPADLFVANAIEQWFKVQARKRDLPARIEALVFDFDGVFTDNRVIVLQDGTEGVVCDRGDGWGIAQLRQQGIPMVVISTETNPVVEARCRKLGIPCLIGVRNKRSTLHGWLQQNGISAENVVYVGNDVNDLECMREVGCAVAPADAHPEVRQVAHIILDSCGGRGALRELAELIIESNRVSEGKGQRSQEQEEV
ncbi:MAG: acylneuraminate cytidylyltransferase [Chthonomonadetes bacterium]|nr:acylneuraminate cytidylyltransferase [Chthonomonadetes bacterium]